MQTFFKKQIALPQDHGSWVFILSPLLVGLFAGNAFTSDGVNLFVAAMAAFMIRQPVTAIVKAYSGRRPKTDLAPAVFWVLVYGLVILWALVPLMLNGYSFLAYLAVPGALVFFWHLWLVSRREERRQEGVEIIATGVLSLAAPAAYWVAIGSYAPDGWWLFLWTWLQSAASIVYAYLRLEQRELKPDQVSSLGSSGLWKLGRRALLYTSFNLAVTLVLSAARLTPPLLFLPFLLQWAETLWGITHPSAGWKPTQIGIRQMIVSTAWIILFILVNR